MRVTTIRPARARSKFYARPAAEQEMTVREFITALRKQARAITRAETHWRKLAQAAGPAAADAGR